MTLYCDKYMRSMPITCKKHLVIAERGIAKIFYYRLYSKQKELTYKQVSAHDKILNAIVKSEKDNKLSEEDFKEIIKNIKNTYKILKKSDKESNTLEFITKQYALHKVNRHLGNAILMEDDSIVFFYDFSDTISGKLNAIFRKGGVL